LTDMTQRAGVLLRSETRLQRVHEFTEVVLFTGLASGLALNVLVVARFTRQFLLRTERAVLAIVAVRSCGGAVSTSEAVFAGIAKLRKHGSFV
jgi:hypothetical protein